MAVSAEQVKDFAAEAEKSAGRLLTELAKISDDELPTTGGYGTHDVLEAIRDLDEDHMTACLANIPELVKMARWKATGLAVYVAISMASKGYVPDVLGITVKKYISQELFILNSPENWLIPQMYAKGVMLDRFNLGVAHKYGHNPQIKTIAAMVEWCLKLLASSKEIRKIYQDERIALYVLNLVSMCTRGNINASKAARINTELNSSTGLHFTINVSDVNMIFKDHRATLDDTIITRVLSNVDEILPEEAAMRLKLVIMQSKFVGLTVFSIIKNAVCDLGGFPWSKVAKLVPADWSHFLLTVALVDKNPYYSYSKDFHRHSSAEYKSLGFVAWRAMIVSGQQSLAHYKGFDNVSIMNKAKLEEVVQQWSTRKTDEETDASTITAVRMVQAAFGKIAPNLNPTGSSDAINEGASTSSGNIGEKYTDTGEPNLKKRNLGDSGTEQ